MQRQPAPELKQSFRKLATKSAGGGTTGKKKGDLDDSENYSTEFGEAVAKLALYMTAWVDAFEGCRPDMSMDAGSYN